MVLWKIDLKCQISSVIRYFQIWKLNKISQKCEIFQYKKYWLFINSEQIEMNAIYDEKEKKITKN